MTTPVKLERCPTCGDLPSVTHHCSDSFHSLERCPVTDEDRQAAAALVRIGAPGIGNGNKVIASEIVGKLHDDYAVVQAFARHRSMRQASRIDEGIVSEEVEPRQSRITPGDEDYE